ncbi:hypothetical protein B0H10DRAFT_1829468, partial [Mycena sp. CBHHK59/15]
MYFGCYVPEPDDEYIISATAGDLDNGEPTMSYTAYKRVDQKVKPISTTQPRGAQVRRTIPVDPLISLPELSPISPAFIPSSRLTAERLKELEINTTGFLLPEEEKLFEHVMDLNQNALAFEDIERGTLSDEYFSPYVIPTVPHTPWEDRNIPIPP